MSSMWVLRISAFFLLITLSESIQSVQLITDNVLTVIFNNSVYSSQFITSHSTFSCSVNNLFTYKQSEQNLINNTPYQLVLSGVSQPTQITISTEYGIISPNLNQSSCNTDCTIEIRNFCPNPVSTFKYFDIIILNIEGMKTLTYNVICNSSYKTNTFEAGEFLIEIACFIMIVLVAVYNRAWAFQINGIEISYLYIFTYGIVEATGGILVLLAPSAAQIIGDVVIWFIGGFGIIICSNEIIFKFRVEFFNKTLINIKKYRIRILELISSFVAFAFLLSWILSDKNWILNDVISVCTIIATIKIFKVTSFKKAIVLYLVEVTIEITFVILIDVLKNINYEDFLINDFNNPLYFELPTINPVYGLKCSWLPISITIFPGILLSYFYRFDNSRNTKIYLITSSVAFFFGAMVWITITSLSEINFPFQSITEPALLILVTLFAYNRKEIKVLWNGKFYDPEFKNQEDHDEETYNYELETKKAEMNENLFDGLRISKDEESESEAQEKSEKEGKNDPENIIQQFKSHDVNDDNI